MADKNPKKAPKHKKVEEKVNKNLHTSTGETESHIKTKKKYE